MKKAWKIVSSVALAAFALGCICFGLSVLMDANLVRIADVVFSHYDLASIYSAVSNTLSQITSALPF